jgi:Zn-finger nucleic acid-binding protein
MLCPICIDTALALSERQGIEIDYCPKCRGIWLDRGEIDKLIERSLEQKQVSSEHQNDQQYYKTEKKTLHSDKLGHKKRPSSIFDLLDFD